jgi:transposase
MNEHKYVAADAHNATTTFTVRDANHHVSMRGTVATREKELIAFVKAIPGIVHLTFEEGTMAGWLYEILHPHVAELIVCDPRKNKLLGHGSKSDGIDADKLSDLLLGGFLTPVYHGENGTKELRSLVRAYGRVVEDSVRLMNQLKAIFRGRGVVVAGDAIYATEGRDAWIAQLPSDALQRHAGWVLRQLDLSMEVRAESEKAMLEAARRRKEWRRMTAVPGIGPIRAAQIIGIVGTPYRFRTKRQLWSYCGLGVVTRSSADYTARLDRVSRKPATRGLNRNHNPTLKDVFKGAAVDAIRSGFRDYHDALVAAGMREEMARLAVARKLVSIILALWKKGETYDPAKTLKRTD